jgi:hypothetical protein
MTATLALVPAPSPAATPEPLLHLAADLTSLGITPADVARELRDCPVLAPHVVGAMEAAGIAAVWKASTS